MMHTAQSDGLHSCKVLCCTHCLIKVRWAQYCTLEFCQQKDFGCPRTANYISQQCITFHCITLRFTEMQNIEDRMGKCSPLCWALEMPKLNQEHHPSFYHPTITKYLKIYDYSTRCFGDFTHKSTPAVLLPHCHGTLSQPKEKNTH